MLDLQPATFEEFEREAERGNVVPVVRVILADLQTPVGAFLRVASEERYAFLLESVEGGERVARYSFLGAEPWMVVRGRGTQTIIERNGVTETLTRTRAIDYVREHFQQRKLARRTGLVPLAGGAVGYLAYDAAHWFEPSLKKNGGKSDDDHGSGKRSAGETDDAVWMFYRTLLAFDRVRQQIEITSIVLTEEAAGSRARLRELYEAAIAETARIEIVLSSAAPDITAGQNSSPSVAPDAREVEESEKFASNWTRDGFESAVEAVKERIAAGDCYQAVLSQRFSKRTTAEPLQIYRALRATNPSPYMYFFKLNDEAIIGASPEMLVRCRGQRLEYRPIAGTRKRGATETEDWMLG